MNTQGIYSFRAGLAVGRATWALCLTSESFSQPVNEIPRPTAPLGRNSVKPSDHLRTPSL